MNNITKSNVLETSAVFDKSLEHRYELNIGYQGEKGKSALVIGLNPTSSDIKFIDTTTRHLINNLGSMGYTEFTVWNLFSSICKKLKVSEIDMKGNIENLQYLEKLLERNFNSIIVGYGNSYVGNKNVEDTKEQVLKILNEKKVKPKELIDADKQYENLHTMHPLFAGQRFSGKWKLRKL